MPIGEEDEPERFARQAMLRENKNVWWAASILIGLHFASRFLRWFIGRPASIEGIDKMLLALGGLYLVSEFLGYKGCLIELRCRTVQINDRLAAIEKRLDMASTSESREGCGIE
jgi:hypothetical protein